MNDAQKKISKATGIKQSHVMSERERIYSLCQVSLLAVERVYEKLEEYELLNEQFALNWLDAINEISVRNQEE